MARQIIKNYYKKPKAKRDENGRFVKDEADLETPSL
jgi:hypothetical protein